MEETAKEQLDRFRDGLDKELLDDALPKGRDHTILLGIINERSYTELARRWDLSPQRIHQIVTQQLRRLSRKRKIEEKKS